GATAEPVDDAFHRVRGGGIRRVLRAIDECAGIYRMRHVPFVLETPQYGADGGVFEFASDVLADSGGGQLAMGPENRQQLVLEIAERWRFMRHSVTTRNIDASLSLVRRFGRGGEQLAIGADRLDQ